VTLGFFKKNKRRKKKQHADDHSVENVCAFLSSMDSKIARKSHPCSKLLNVALFSIGFLPFKTNHTSIFFGFSRSH